MIFIFHSLMFLHLGRRPWFKIPQSFAELNRGRQPCGNEFEPQMSDFSTTHEIAEHAKCVLLQKMVGEKTGVTFTSSLIIHHVKQRKRWDTQSKLA